MTPTISKLSTGATVFSAAGYLVFAMMTNNGGSDESQRQWRAAERKSVSLSEVTKTEVSHLQGEQPHGIDQTVTGSIRNIADGKVAKRGRPVEQELTVLELIRKNSDVSPGVSSGTNRVSIIVEKGDTLFGISQRHGISVNSLAALNSLKEPFTIRLGQTLYLAR